MSTEIELYDEDDDDLQDDMGIVVQTTREVATTRVLNGFYTPDYRTRVIRVDIRAYYQILRQLKQMIVIRGFFVVSEEFSDKFVYITIKSQPGSRAEAKEIIHIAMLMQQQQLKQIHAQKAIETTIRIQNHPGRTD